MYSWLAEKETEVFDFASYRHVKSKVVNSSGLVLQCFGSSSRVKKGSPSHIEARRLGQERMIEETQDI